MIERTEQEWADLHCDYKRRFAAAKKAGITFKPLPEEKEAHRRYGAAYAATERGRSILRAGSRKYKQSEHGKVAAAVYNHSESRRESSRKYSRTPQGRLTTRRAKAKWRGHQPPDHVDVDRLVTEQHGVCVICRIEFSDKRPPCVDHCHESGAVRGALCNRCNLAIGLLEEQPDRLQNAAMYLEAVKA